MLQDVFSDSRFPVSSSITEEHRLVHVVFGNQIKFLQARYHY